MKKKLMLLLLLLLFIVIPSSYAQLPEEILEKLENYEINIVINDDDSIHIKQSFDVVNYASEPIVPGKARMVLFERLKPESVIVSIGGSKKQLSDKDIVEEGNKVIINYEIWQPLLEGERLKVEIDFDAKNVVQRGILFEAISLKLSESDVPIKKLTFLVEVPDGRYISYTNPKPSSVEANKASIVFEDLSAGGNEFTVEYSVLPLPLLPFHGYWLWLVLVIIPILIWLWKVIKVKKNKSNVRTK